MTDIRRRLSACALIVVSSIVVTEAQQRGRGPERSRADRAADAGGVVTSVDADGYPKVVRAAGARRGPLGRDARGRGTLASSSVRARVRRDACRCLGGRHRERGDAQLRRRHRGTAPARSRRRSAGQRREGHDARRPRARRDFGPPACDRRRRDALGTVARGGTRRRSLRAVRRADVGLEHLERGDGQRRRAIPDRGEVRGSRCRRPHRCGRSCSRSADGWSPPTSPSSTPACSIRSTPWRFGTSSPQTMDGCSNVADLTVSEKKHDPPPAPPVDFLYRVYAEPSNQRPLDGPQQDLSPHPTGFPDGTTSPFLPSNLVTMGGFNNPRIRRRRFVARRRCDGNQRQQRRRIRRFFGPGRSHAGRRLPRQRHVAESLRSHVRHDPWTDRDGRSVQGLDHERVLHGQLAARLLVRLGLRRGGRQRAAEQLRPRRRRRRSDARRGAGQLPRRIPQQREHVHAVRRHSPRMQMYTWFGPHGRDLDAHARRKRPGRYRVVRTDQLRRHRAGLARQRRRRVRRPTPASRSSACLAGRIVLVDRGTCAFAIKARNAQAAGAVGIIIANNVAGAHAARAWRHRPARHDRRPVDHSGRRRGAEDRARWRGRSRPACSGVTGTERDGAIDNTIVAHEWGHYLHHRLADCGLQQCGAMSEGWGDFIALHTIARAGDNLNGTFALATYATSAFDPNSAYFGIRRVPYSVDFTKNAFTFKHISDGVALPAVPTLPGGAELRGAQRRRSLDDDAVGRVRGAAEGTPPPRDLRRGPAAHGRLRRGGPQDGAARCDVHRAARRHSRRGQPS